MPERLNPLLRLVCLALAGLVIYQASRLMFQRDAVARSSFEAPMLRAYDKPKTNDAAAVPPTNTPPTGPAMARINRGGPPGMGAPGPALPADVQATIEKIKQSQLLGPDIKSPPMALLGIAGKEVFLRGPNGQTGMIREGEELGGVKLIRIGTNRVIVEENKEQKELTIFNGFGSETLLEKKDKREPLH